MRPNHCLGRLPVRGNVPLLYFISAPFIVASFALGLRVGSR
jgi:hypothetical protein